MTKWREFPRADRRWVIYDLIRKLQPLATVIAVHQAVYEQYGKDLSLAWIYHTLDRLEHDGFLASELRDHPDPQVRAWRGNRPARFYFATGKPKPQSEQKESDLGLAGGIFHPAFIIAGEASVPDRERH